MAPGHVLLIRADADARMGTGHLMRCLALAQTWQTNGGQVTFITACHNSGLLNRLHNEGFEVQQLPSAYPNPMDWELTQSILARYPNAWVVLDGYHFEPTYQLQIKTAGHPLLIVDDMAHMDIYHADILLNQNINAQQLSYKVEPKTRLLLGTQYALLRREFWPWRGWQRQTSTVARKILVTLGGGDIDNQTLKVIHALQLLKVEDLEAIIVVGGSNPHLEVLKTAVLQSSVDIQLVQNVSNMSELMAWADIAVSAGGSTCWELAFMGLPSLVMIMADNQVPITQKLDELDVVKNLGWYQNISSHNIGERLAKLLFNIDQRARMCKQGQQLVDGVGATRVIELMKNQEICLRQVCQDDCKLIWEWSNDPLVRSASFSSDFIPWEKHIAWFNLKMNDPNCAIFIAMDSQDSPIGQVRYEIESDTAVISISIDGRFRGKSYGSKVINLACEKIFATTDIDTVHAFIKLNNEASVRAFDRAGFKAMDNTIVKGCQARHLILQKGRQVI